MVFSTNHNAWTNMLFFMCSCSSINLVSPAYITLLTLKPNNKVLVGYYFKLLIKKNHGEEAISCQFYRPICRFKQQQKSELSQWLLVSRCFEHQLQHSDWHGFMHRLQEALEPCLRRLRCHFAKNTTAKSASSTFILDKLRK